MKSIKLRSVKKVNEAPANSSVKDQALALAQLALDIFIDKKHVVGVKSGQNYANQDKKT